MTRLSVKAAVQVKDSVVKKIDDEMQKAATSKTDTPIDVGDEKVDVAVESTSRAGDGSAVKVADDTTTSKPTEPEAEADGKGVEEEEEPQLGHV